MTWAVPTVEINMADNNATANWVNVSTYVKKITTNTGRTSELETFNAGTCTVVLENRDSRFDPTNTTGPYFGLLDPRRKIRISTVFSAVTYWQFYGYIRGWPQATDSFTGISTVTLECFDQLGAFAQKRLNGSPFVLYTDALHPSSWFRLVDPQGARQVVDYYGKYNIPLTGEGNFLGQIVQGDNTPVGFLDAAPIGEYYSGPLDIEKCYYQDTVSGGILSKEIQLLTSGATVFSVSWTMRVSGPQHYQGVATNVHLFSLGYNVNAYLEMSNSDPLLRGRVVGKIGMNSPFTLSSTFAPGTAMDEQWHQYWLTYDGVDHKLYIDGNLVASVGYASKNADLPAGVSIGIPLPTTVAAFTTHVPFVGYMHDFMVFTSYCPSAGVIQESWQAWNNWEGQRSGDRLATLLNLVGYFGSTDIPFSYAFLGALKGVSGSLLDTMQSVAKSEGGGIYMTPDGVFKMRNRHELVTATRSTTAQATFKDDGSGGTTRFIDPTHLLRDDGFIYNEVVFSNDQGNVYIARDGQSIQIYESSSLEMTGLQSASDNDLAAGANFYIRQYAYPFNRLPSLTMDARVGTTEMTKALDLRIGDKISVSRLPPGGTRWTVNTWIEGISHEIDLERLTWRTRYTLSQRGTLQSGSAFVLGTSLLGGTDKLVW